MIDDIVRNSDGSYSVSRNNINYVYYGNTALMIDKAYQTIGGILRTEYKYEVNNKKNPGFFEPKLAIKFINAAKLSYIVDLIYATPIALFEKDLFLFKSGKKQSVCIDHDLQNKIYLHVKNVISRKQRITIIENSLSAFWKVKNFKKGDK